MSGDHQRASHSASRGMTRSPNSARSGGVGLVPVGPLPAGRLEEDGAQVPFAAVHRREAQVAVGGPLLHRVDDAVGLVEALGRAGPDVVVGPLVVVEAGDVRAVGVDLRLARRSSTRRPSGRCPAPP